MTISTNLLVKVLLAAVALIFVWFFVGEAISPEDTDQLLAVAATGFGLAAIRASRARTSLTFPDRCQASRLHRCRDISRTRHSRKLWGRAAARRCTCNHGGSGGGSTG